MTQPTILDAVDDPELFARWFERGDWRAWRAFLAALFALPMDRAAGKLYRRCTGRQRPPSRPFGEGWLVVGRRGGKSFIAALVAVWLACFRDYRAHLQPGERGTVLVIAADRRQARTILRYVNGLLDGVPMLASLVERRTAEGVDLNTRVSIEVHTASFRSVRGYTIVAALLDEVAFWRSEDSAEPDHEIVGAIRPGMATIPGAMLLGLSSPYAKRGVLYEAHKRYYDKDGDVLVWQAPTRTMNPTVPERVVQDAMQRDEAWARAEYLAEFRDDIESFVSREVVEACVRHGPVDLPYVARYTYRAFVDPSGGSNDAMTLAIGHDEGERVVIDAVRERKPPFSPDDVVREFADLCRDYRIASVTGDRYAGEWPRERFDVHRIRYDVADRVRSELYRDLLPMMNSGRIELPNNERLTMQIAQLERRTGRGGKDSIDHPPGGHDDLANAVAGLVQSGKRRKRAGVLFDAGRVGDDWHHERTVHHA